LLNKTTGIPVADLGEGPGGPRLLLFWLEKKNRRRKKKPTGQANPPTPLSSRSGSATEYITLFPVSNSGAKTWQLPGCQW